MSTFDIIFWLLIVLIAVLAYVIESGLSGRHRTLVLSSILSATGAAVMMMFLVDDNSSFGTGTPPPAGEKAKRKVYATQMGEGDGFAEVEVIDAPTPDFVDSGQRYEDSALLRRPGGFRDCPACPLMALVQPGNFVIGSFDDEPGRQANEGPRKLIRFARPFAVSRYEIQYGEFAAFVKSASHYVRTNCTAADGASVDWQRPGIEQKTAQHPVVCIAWSDAQAYAGWLTRTTGRVYRLPSESEWEYVARGGTATPYWTGDTISSSQANFGGANNGTTAAGRYGENAFKVFDVAGNVWEMTADCWNDTLANIPSSGVADLGNGSCSASAVRGGAWNSPPNTLRAAYRRPLPRNQAFNTVGFRLVREIK